MKKIICALIALVVLVAVLASCSEGAVVEVEGKDAQNTSMFIEVERTDYWRVVYHKDTKVMYVISYGAKNSGNFTVMVDRYGFPLVWEGDK
jgi:molybdopterin biosynthesis enzyme